MTKSIAVLATLDTKGPEAHFLCAQLERLGSTPVLLDVGVMGTPAPGAQYTREVVAERGGESLEQLTSKHTREHAQPVMARGATTILTELLAEGLVDGVVGLGGLQGTALCTEVMRALPYGFPKVMLSTVASGDTSAYVDVKDITMMFSVSDILGLNAFTRKVLARAAGAAHGMALVDVSLQDEVKGRRVIGMTNLGVLTEGAMHAVRCFEQAGFEVVVFHAVGSGGRAMEQMMKEGLLCGVFDYGLGEISDEVFEGLRAGGPERLTVAGRLGLPQVIVPGGAEHLGVLVDPPNTVPERYAKHRYVFHNPVVFVPRLSADELVTLAGDICRRLGETRGDAVFMVPEGGTGSYARAGGDLHDPEGDAAFFAALEEQMPKTIEFVRRPEDAEDPAFVEEAVRRLVALIEQKG